MSYFNTENNYEDYLDKTHVLFPSIFSPNIDNIDILELSSLNNSSDFNSIYGVKVEKLLQTSNREANTTNSAKKALILDLDETLVHSSTKRPFPNKKNIILNITIKNIKYRIYVIVRPFFEKFLYEMSLCYDLYIFTASMSQYSKSLIEILDKNKVIKQVLSREYCLNIKGVPLKDLSIFNKDLKDIIIIDNNPVSYSLHKNNGIPILTWIDNPKDNELLKLIPILKYLSKAKDVRPIINKILNKSKKKVNFFKVNEILKIDNKLKQINKNKNTKNNKDLNNLNENLIKSTNLNKSDEVNNSKENNLIKSQPLQINKKKNIIKYNNDIINIQINKQNIIKKLRINKTKNIQIKEKINSPIKIIGPELNKKPNIYNIKIQNLNNVENKINIFNSVNVNSLDKEPINSNKKANLPKKEIIKKININNKIFGLNKGKIKYNIIFKNKLKKYKIIGKKVNLTENEFSTDKSKRIEEEINKSLLIVLKN